MKILLVYPKNPDSFWGFKHALHFISKKAAVPPLGLITVAGMLPPEWPVRLIDMNVTDLKSKDIIWADYVFISAMYVHKESVDRIIAECQKNQVKIVAGGPLFTQEYENYPQIDHFILNEAELTLYPFLRDLEAGRPERIYQTTEYADLSKSPVPKFNLLSVKDYAFLNLQIGRGCPFACDFCEITSLLGHKVRMKTTNQVISELQALYDLNWRGSVQIVDDNFIGNRKEIKSNLLPAMAKWMKLHKYPFKFSTQSSIDLADDKELMTMMIEAGVGNAFIGIETTEEKSLIACNKVQNKNRDLLQSVRIIQKAGMEVSGGFIVGFDSDSPSVFQRQIDFIQQSGILSAMVGLLNAPKNTRLYERMETENRLTSEATGNNTDFSMNFMPKMDKDELQDGYRKIIKNIYSSKPYYKRARTFLLNYKNRIPVSQKINLNMISAFVKSVIVIGIVNKGRREYWKFLLWTLFNRPEFLINALTTAVYGYHYRTIYGLRSKRN